MSQMSEGQDNVILHIQHLVNHLHNSTHESKPIIFKVDDHLRQVNEKDYEPEILAIGPIHHGKDNVKNMEQHKVRYLEQLLQRQHELSIEKCVLELRNMQEKARLCYGKPIHLDEDEFVEMMLLDGCFVIELIRKYLFDDLRDKNDPIFQFDQTLGQIRHDLMLFENQLPFFVLNHLFDMTKMEDPEDNICHLVLLFVDDMFPWLDISKINSTSNILPNVDHLLALVYQFYFPFSTKYFVENKGHKENSVHTINSASRLKESGIRLKGSKEITPLDVTFVDGVLKLPPLDVSDKTESILRNLIAYESCLSNDHPKHVTDYTFFMHCLVNSTKDIEILQRQGIIRNFLGGDDMIYRMFNALGKNVVVSSDFCYSDIFRSLNRHCRLRHKTWMAKLKRNYFNSPWAMVSFLVLPYFSYSPFCRLCFLSFLIIENDYF